MNKLEEAAREHADGFERIDPGQDESIQSARIVGFKRGAEWQAKQSPWIRVEERLPVERLDKEVSSSALSELVFIRAWSYGHELIGTCKRENGKWAYPFPGVQKDSYTITHWMPIHEV